jgi:DNA mismatch endonuclease, patch repair protein
MDIYSPQKRSALMGSVRTANTAPELAVKAVLRKLHVTFTGRSDHLPGRPDIVLPDSYTALLVHGCFWHHHRGCTKAKLPTTNRKFWRDKIAGNVSRDRRDAAALRRAGWKVKVVWECETRKSALPVRVARLLGVSLAH